MEESSNVSLETENTLSTNEIVQAVDHEYYTPRPFKEIPGLWLKIFKMDAAFFENEIKHTSVMNTLLGVLLFSSITSVLFYLPIYLNIVQIPKVGNLLAQYHWNIDFSPFSIPFISLLVLPLIYYLGSFIFFLSAKLLKGTGTFTEQIYLESLISPIPYFINQLGNHIHSQFPQYYLIAAFIPISVLSIFILIVRIRAYKIVHGFSTKNAILMIFTPYIILLGFCMCSAFFMGIIRGISQG